MLNPKLFAKERRKRNRWKNGDSAARNDPPIDPTQRKCE